MSVVRGPWSVVSGQWSVVSGQWSVVRGPWSVVVFATDNGPLTTDYSFNETFTPSGHTAP